MIEELEEKFERVFKTLMLGDTELPEKIRVYTVRTGGVFSTGVYKTLEEKSYTTEEEALKGHEEMCEKYK